MKRAIAWAADWRNGATVIASVLVALLFFVVVDGAFARREAREMSIESAKASQLEVQRGLDSRQAATARIDNLQNRITDLVNAVQAQAEAQSKSRAEAEALETQIKNLGVKPVVIVDRSPVTMPPSAVRPSETPSQGTTTTTTTTTAPNRVNASTTTTTTPRVVPRSLVPVMTTTSTSSTTTTTIVNENKGE